MTQTVGFLGTGTMGEPMVRNLLQAGISVVVWNRTPVKTRALEAEGATVATEVSEVLARANTVMAMLATSEALDTVLKRGSAAFAQMMQGHTLVQLGITSPSYSQKLDMDIRSVGGRYLESPVVGSRNAAEIGTLISLVGGSLVDAELMSPLLGPMCQESIFCGEIPLAMATKLASNMLIGTTLASLAETANFARTTHVDLGLLFSIINRGPLASRLIQMKASKLIAQEFSTEASLANLLKVTELLIEAAREKDAPTPMLDTSYRLFSDAALHGSLDEDVMAVIRVFENALARKI